MLVQSAQLMLTVPADSEAEIEQGDIPPSRHTEQDTAFQHYIPELPCRDTPMG